MVVTCSVTGRVTAALSVGGLLRRPSFRLLEDLEGRLVRPASLDPVHPPQHLLPAPSPGLVVTGGLGELSLIVRDGRAVAEKHLMAEVHVEPLLLGGHLSVRVRLPPSIDPPPGRPHASSLSPRVSKKPARSDSRSMTSRAM